MKSLRRALEGDTGAQTPFFPSVLASRYDVIAPPFTIHSQPDSARDKGQVTADPNLHPQEPPCHLLG